MKKIIISFTFILCMGFLFFIENKSFIFLNNTNNIGIKLYQSEEYELAQEIFDTLSQNKESNINLFNKGNALYQIGNNSEDINTKKQYFNESLEAFSGSLVLKDDTKTHDNYNYVLNELEKLEEKQEQEDENKQEEENKQESTEGENQEDDNSEIDNGNEEGSEGSEGEKSEESGEGNESKDTKTQDENNSTESKSQSEKQSQLSDNEKEAIKSYTERLKQIEEQNQKYFNKKEPDISNQIETFMNQGFMGDKFKSELEKNW
ncbi:MAG: hypothetical protein GY828_04680 [Candidatus Gracilibacteria bacterium]|nr:hypothetical protein [Candidatus Gracilibacteria bacterium]